MDDLDLWERLHQKQAPDLRTAVQRHGLGAERVDLIGSEVVTLGGRHLGSSKASAIQSIEKRSHCATEC